MKYAFAHFHLIHALTYMYIFAIPMVLSLFFFKKDFYQKIKAMRPHIKTVALFLFLTLANGIAFYIALDLIGLSGLAITGRLTTVMMIITGVILYKERLSRTEVIFAIALILSGVIYSLSETHTSVSLWGIVAALFAGLTWICMNVIWKNTSHTIDGLAFGTVRSVIIGICYFLICAVMVFYGFIAPLSLDISSIEILYFFGVALLLPILPYIFTPYAYQTIGLSLTAVINSIQPALSLIIGIFIFHEPLDDIKLVAALIAIGSGVLYALFSLKKSRGKVSPES